MISVVVPAYNSEKTIASCLQSLASQTFSRDNYEIIVVDDGSTDHTKKIVGRFSQVRYYKKKNEGPAAARNFGAQKAQGDILLFIDSDCEADEHWIEEMVCPFEQASTQAVKGIYKTKQKGLVPRLIQIEFEERYDKMARSKGLDFMDFSAGAIRKATFDSLGGFRQDLQMSEDVQFAYELSKAGHTIVFAKKAVVYHSHPATLGTYLKVKFWRSYWRMDVYKNFPKKILRDSYTPQTLKAQIVFLFLLPLTLLLMVMIPAFIYIVCFELLILALFIVPLTFRAFKKGILQGLVIPFFIIGRGISLGFGILYYFLEIKNLRELFSFIILALIVVVPSFFTGGRDLFAQAFVFVLSFPLLFFTLRSNKKMFGDRIPLHSNIVLPLLLLFVVMVISIFISVTPTESVSTFLAWLSYGIIFLSVWYLVSSKGEGHKFGFLIITLAFVLSIIGIYFFIQTEFYHYLRAISTFYQHNPFAGFLLFALPLVFAYLLLVRGKKRTVVLAVAAVCIVLAFVLTHSRGAWMSFLAPFAVIIYFSIIKRKNIFKTISILALTVVIVALGWFGLYQLKAHQAEQAAGSESVSSATVATGYSVETSEENAVIARLHFWNGAWNIFKDNPVMGTGLETYKNVYRQYLDDIRYYSIDPHNVYLKAFAEMGIIGGTVFLWFVGVVLILIVKSLLLIKKIERDSDKALLLGLSMGLFGSLTHNFVELDWQFPTNVITFFIALGVFYKVYLLQRRAVVGRSDHESKNFLYHKATVVIMPLVALLVMTGGILLFFSETYQTAGNNALSDFELTKAQQAYSNSIRFNPLSNNAHFGLAQVYYYLIPEDKEYYLSLYIEELEKVISLNAGDYRARKLLGTHYLRSDYYQNSIEYFEQAVKANRVGMPELYLALATAYHKQGSAHGAIIVLEQAVDNYQPSLEDSVIWIANDREAILNDIARLHVGLGSLYHEQEDVAMAKEQYEKALEYDSDNEKALQNLSKLLLDVEIENIDG